MIEEFENEWKDIQKIEKGPERTNLTLSLLIKVLTRIGKLMDDSEKKILQKFLDGEIDRKHIKCNDEELTQLLKEHKLI